MMDGAGGCFASALRVGGTPVPKRSRRKSATVCGRSALGSARARWRAVRKDASRSAGNAMSRPCRRSMALGGGAPVRAWKSVAPKQKRSVQGPKRARGMYCSGAAYFTVRMPVFCTVCPASKRRAEPKSISTVRPSKEQTMLAGLMSRCRILHLCTSSRASHMFWARCRASCMESAPSSCSRVSKVRPFKYSITM